MKYKLLIPALFLSFSFLQGQNLKSDPDSSSSVSFDFYGFIFPYVEDNINIRSNVHLSMSFDGVLGHGPCISLWSHFNEYRGYRFTGIGYQLSPKSDKILLKFETGLLVNFLRRDLDIYRVELKPWRTSTYLRLHLGYKYNKRFVFGIQGNWIPPTQAVRFTQRGIPFREFEEFSKPPNQDLSLGFFVGIRID